jgi:hypothetical protein
MKRISTRAILALSAGFAVALSANMASAGSEANAHIGHVVSSWQDTPSERGLLPTATREALVAAAHANYSVNAADDFGTMKVHARHVRHAIDPTLEAGGPGMGYGLILATEGAIKHITFARETADTTEAIKAHTVHVVTSLQNAVDRTKLALIEVDAILAAANSAEALPHAEKLAELTKAALMGFDANGDGKISWEKDEGGLKTADKHMGFILDAEGLKR